MSRDILPEGYKLHWYTIESVLGRGAFGVTYLARDQNLDQLVAIKEYFPNQFSSRITGYTVQPVTGEQREMYEWGLDRFIKEARTLAKFKHHNIVRVFSVFEHNNTAYMVMEYEQGQELTQLYKSTASLTEEQLLSIYLPISSGLKLIHDAGFIHRDIKPANIYLRTTDHSPVLLDFGSARKVTKSQTQALTSLVTPGYAPFEQFNEGDDKQGPWTDIYALGASIYYGVAGRLPIDSMARGSGLLSNGIDPYEPAATAAIGKYTPEFLSAIDAALRFNSNQRPQNINVWAAMLNAGQKQEEILTEQPAAQVDNDATIMTPRTRNAQTEKVDYGNKSGLTQTLKTTLFNIQQLPWQRQSFIWLGATVLSVAVLLTLIQSIVSEDTAKPLVVDTATAEQTVVDKPAIDETEPAAAKIDSVNLNTAQDLQIKALLARANDASKQENFFEPAQQNAIYYYQQIQKLDINNQTASIAIEGIVSQYSDEIRTDIRAKRLDQASRKVALLQATMPEDTSVAKLQQEIEALSTQRSNNQQINTQNIATWLRQAKIHLAKSRLTKPRNKNALEYFQRVIAIAPDNQNALEGIDTISQFYITRAKINLKDHQLSKLDRDIKLAESVNPNLPSLPDLQKKLKQQRKKANKLLQQAKKAYDAGKLTQPSKKSALYYYSRVFNYDRSSSKAEKGIEQTNKRITSIFDMHMKNGKYAAAESVLKSLELHFPKSAITKKLHKSFSQNGANPKSDIYMTNKMIGDFKRNFEARDINSLENMLVYRKGLRPFLRNFFSSYASFTLIISNLKFISKKRMGSADVEIANLSNEKGAPIQAGAWSRFKIIPKRNKHGRWKISWEDADK